MYKYIQHYPPEIQQQVTKLIEQDKLGVYLENKYPNNHQIQTDSLLYDYVMEIKNQYMKKSAPISKVVYDKNIKDAANSLGTHTYRNRVQGNKIKSKNEIRISTFFKQTPLAMLNMIVVHELAHVREKEHNKAFYQLCQHMLADYHQLELDTRLFLLCSDMKS
ncbi:metal-dependent hydrolase [Saccharobesus litoralis]|uniref:Metal-dependent hydrolase n=1 Tax=Saccharobesus litoralis TaxID=2172099 RepID=A0A2S0VVV9_9ALTE|nr:YgjP-like metallopeptidase domain-containing protein [Saccharobesus litoralis]AWB68349.1 metal-dependent hydrolase [Saccharobesus litoralis]